MVDLWAQKNAPPYLGRAYLELFGLELVVEFRRNFPIHIADNLDGISNRNNFD
mgnify:CR=1 FL=1